MKYKSTTYFNKPWGLFLVLMVLYWNTVHSQINLVQNGDFETLSLINFEQTTINGQIVELNRRDTSFLWWSASIKEHYHVSSPYWYFSSDSMPKTETRYSKSGKTSHSGHTYATITPFKPDANDSYSITNIVGTLCKPLIAGNTYEVSFWLRPYKGNFFIDNIGVHFTDQMKPYYGKVKYKHPKEKDKPQNYDWIIENIFQPERLKYNCHIQQLLNNTDKYVELKCEYKAKGGETYIYIGNLNYDFPEKFRKKDLQLYGRTRAKFSRPECEYLIDDVSLISLSDSLEACEIAVDTLVQAIEYPLVITEIPIRITEENTPKILVNPPVKSVKQKTIILDNYYFETDSFTLKSAEQEQLMDKIRALIFEQIKHIEIIGHTDNQGDVAYNMNLSLQRARTIQQYIRLINEQISLDSKGKGSSVPIASNDTMEGRSKNRRVELIIYYW